MRPVGTPASAKLVRAYLTDCGHIRYPSHSDRRTGEPIKDTPFDLPCVARDPFARNFAALAKKGDRLVV